MLVEVTYTRKSSKSPDWESEETRFIDWADFAEFLEDSIRNGRPVLITEWNYIRDK